MGGVMTFMWTFIIFIMSDVLLVFYVFRSKVGAVNKPVYA